MRIALILPLLALPLTLAACNVDNDAGNDTMRVEYDQERIENGAAAAARTAREVGSGVGNVAASAGSAIKNEVGDIDVDLDVTRNRDGGNVQVDTNTAR
jgi:predicted small secreted protein